MDACKQVGFYLAANSGKGFFSLFDELHNPHENWKLYIIKGGPGTGKSSLMRKIADFAFESGLFVEYIYCSSDPDSLDGVIIPELKVSICDGTSPHVIEPKYPGVSEILINLGEYWDNDKIEKGRDHIITLTDCNKSLHRRASRYISAAGAAVNENDRIFATMINIEKVDNFVTRFISRNISCDNSVGNEKKRFISGFTPKGYNPLFDTVQTMCDKIFTVTDEYGAVSGILIEKLRRYALSSGADIITCLNPLSPLCYPSHIIFEKEKIGFFTSNSAMNFKHLSDKNINFSRFVDHELFTHRKNRIQFNKKAADSFITEAFCVLEKAKSVHDELESYYIQAMDFESMGLFSDNLIKTIFGQKP